MNSSSQSFILFPQSCKKCESVIELSVFSDRFDLLYHLPHDQNFVILTVMQGVTHAYNYL